MWRWIILIGILGLKIGIPLCCVRFNSETPEKPAIKYHTTADADSRFEMLTPYMDSK